MKLEGRIAVVTGGGSGIGRAIALLFAEEGAHVVVNDVTLERAQKTVDEMAGSSGRGRAIAADVSDSSQVRRMFAEVEREVGGPDILVNNAGIAGGDPERRRAMAEKFQSRVAEMLSGEPIQTHWDITVSLSDEDWHRMIGVHLNGTFFCTREALRLMSPRNRGSIVNISSVAALTGLELVPHYSAAKGAILAFTRAVARDVGARNIRVNAICPGYIDTPMTEGMPAMMKTAVLSRTPLNRWGEPREVAATALFLASDDSAFYTGQWLSPNGGLFIG